MVELGGGKDGWMELGVSVDVSFTAFRKLGVLRVVMEWIRN